MDTFSWFCGYMEGEGSFLKPPPSAPKGVVIVVQTTDEDVAKKIASILECKYQKTKKYAVHHKQCYSVRRSGKYAERVMRAMLPHMSSRRQEQINEALKAVENLPKYTNQKTTNEQLESIHRLYEEGIGPAEIARRLGVSIYTASRVARNKSYKKLGEWHC